MKKEVFLVLVLLSLLLGSCSGGAREKQFLCPKTSEISYDEATDTYFFPVGCEPSAPGCGPSDEYMAEAAEKCPYKLEERQVK